MDKLEIAKFAKRSYIEMQVDGLLPSEVYEIYVKEHFDTASWRFYEDKHRIVIGTGIFSNVRIDMSEVEKENYLKAFLFHELAHSIWTQKNLNKLAKDLTMLGLPFVLFNLFEDARIEEKMRKHIKKPFNWLKYESLSEPTNALGMFFYILQSEHRKESLLKLSKIIGFEKRDELNIVINIYKRVLACETSGDLIPILEDWICTFPETINYINEIKPKNYLFSEESKYSMNDEKFDELLEGAENILSITSDAENGKIPVQGLSSNIPKLRKRLSASLLSKKSVEVAYDTKLRDVLLCQMEKLFFESRKVEATRIPSKRLNLKRMATGSEKIFKRRENLKTVKKNITIILDLSCSMDAIIQHMRLLIDVINKMAERNIIDATLILTGVTHMNANYEVLSMPISDDIISKIVPKYGGDGLKGTVESNIEILSKSDYNWFLTDGFIDEDALNKDLLHSYGIKTHAMYIGDVSYRVQLEKSFDHVVCEKSVEDLAKEIFMLIKN